MTSAQLSHVISTASAVRAAENTTLAKTVWEGRGNENRAVRVYKDRVSGAQNPHQEDLKHIQTEKHRKHQKQRANPPTLCIRMKMTLSHNVTPQSLMPGFRNTCRDLNKKCLHSFYLFIFLNKSALPYLHFHLEFCFWELKYIYLMVSSAKS